MTFPGIAGIAFDTSGDVFISYDSTTSASGRRQSVAEVTAGGYLASSGVFSTTGASAFPGALAAVGTSADLPSLGAGTFLELLPDGQLFAFDPNSGTSTQYDNLAGVTPAALSVRDIQSGSAVDLSGRISLSNATFGDFGIYQDSLVVSAESNNWDFVMRVSYGASKSTATVLAASPASDGRSASPGGVAVDSAGTVLTTMPYLPSGSATAIHVPVGFGLFYDQGAGPSPSMPTLGLASVPNIDSGGIAVDSQDNFILAVKDSSLYGGGQGVVHINGALTAFLADPTPNAGAIPSAIACQDVNGSSYLAFTDAASDTYTLAGELPLFSGQVTPSQLRSAYGIDQITFGGPGGTTISGDGTGQTIAIVEEGVDPTLAADLAIFDQHFGIPAPPSFQIINQNNVGTQNLSIVGEASLDVEWAHAIAPGASIVVYNAAYDPNDGVTSFQNLMKAMQEASKLPGVSVVSLSYGLPENAFASMGLSQSTFDSYFNTPGVTFVVAAGDSGIYGNGGYQVSADYPAASPNVLAVGGTSIVIGPTGAYPGTGTTGEVAWGSGASSGSSGGGGGGLSAVEARPSWQTGVVPTAMDPYGARALPDVSIDSGAAQQYDVFTSTLAGSSISASAVGWLGDAGTSAGAPIWAGLIAIANQGRALAGASPLTGNTQTLPALYALPSSDFHDIVHGNNGYAATTGYDLASGLGSPIANLLVPDLAGYQVASRMSITAEPPSSIPAGLPFGLTVSVTDSLGHPVSGGTVTVALANNPGDATLGGMLTANVVDGVTTFSGLTLNLIGSDYTLTLTGPGITGSLTTSPIDVGAGLAPTSVAVTATPVAPAFGQPMTLTATVSILGGSGVPTGAVTFKESSTVLGTATLDGGVASLTTTPTAGGRQSITAVYSGDASNQSSSIDGPLMIAPAPASLVVNDATFSYDGMAHGVSVTITPAGLSGVTLSYSLNGVPVAAPTRAGTYTVTATLSSSDYTASPASGTLVIGQATPTLSWVPPAGIVAGTPLGSAQLEAVATFAGRAVAGVMTYSPAAGTVLPVGNGQILTLRFTPSDAVDFRAVTASVPIDVSPLPSPSTTPTPTPTIIGELPVFRRKLRRNGKPFGRPILVGYQLTFNGPLVASAASNPSNYELDIVAPRRGKKTARQVMYPFAGFNVSYTPGSDTVTIEPTRPQLLRKGGQITVLPAVTGGLSGTSVFTIGQGGKSIRPA